MQVHFTINIDERLVKAVKSFFKRRSVIVVTICVIVSTLLLAYAADMDDTNSIQFQPDTIIRSSELNSKFNYIYSVLQTGGLDLVGFIMPYYGDPNDAPSGWELCDGTSRKVTSDGDYQVLCNRITQTTCSAGDTVYLPDLQGRVVAGVDPTSSVLSGMDDPNDKSGSASIELTATQLPPHVHEYTDKVRAYLSKTLKEDSGGGTSIPYVDSSAYSSIPDTPYTEDPIFYWQYDASGTIVDQNGDNTIDSNDLLEVTSQESLSVVQPTIALYYMIRTQ